MMVLLLLELVAMFHVIKRFRARSMRELREILVVTGYREQHKSFVVVTYFVGELDSRETTTTAVDQHILK